MLSEIPIKILLEYSNEVTYSILYVRFVGLMIFKPLCTVSVEASQYTFINVFVAHIFDLNNLKDYNIQ